MGHVRPGGVVSTIHATLKFPTPKGVGTVYANKQCACAPWGNGIYDPCILKFPTPKGVGTVYANKQCAASETVPVSPDEKVELWAPNPNFPDQQVRIGEVVPEPFRATLK
jgi:hypothetical protein